MGGAKDIDVYEKWVKEKLKLKGEKWGFWRVTDYKER